MNQKNPLPFISILALFAAIIFLPLSLAPAAETTDYEVVPCHNTDESLDTDMYAEVFDTDSAGLNVRGGPGTNYPVIATLPTDRKVVVTVTGSVGEWIRIKDAAVCTGTGITNVHLVGWVHGTLLSVMVVGWGSSSKLAPLYAEPNTASSIIAKIHHETYVTVAGCREGWMKVRYRELEGWLAPESHGFIEGLKMCYLVITALEENDAVRPGPQNVSSPGPR